jgi:hydroxymethylbilane synthase
MPSSIEIVAAARSSPLSKVQLTEVLGEIRAYFPEVHFRPLLLEVMGDLDQKTSLRNLDKTDFFTREIDQLLLAGKCQIGIHSAKDLPDPLPKSLRVVALTKGVDPSDSLVMREGSSLQSLPKGALIGTSSVRREENLKMLRGDFRFADIRGKIFERIQKLENKEVDGVVIAEAALLRLQLTHLNRIKIPGEPAPLQGRLAVVAREDDSEMARLFSTIDTRK